MLTIRIRPDKIRLVIGKNGNVIRGIVEETSCKIDIEDDGTVRLTSTDDLALGTAITRIIEAIT